MCRQSGHYVVAVVDHNHNWLFLFSVESWHLPINLSTQIAPDYISEYLNFQNFPGRRVPRPPQHVTSQALTAHATCMECKARQKHQLALYIIQLVVTVASSICDVEVPRFCFCVCFGNPEIILARNFDQEVFYRKYCINLASSFNYQNTSENRVKRTIIVSASHFTDEQGSQIRQIGVFYAKIVQMTPRRLRRESLRLQKFSLTNREPLRLQKFAVTSTVLSLPFSHQIQFTLIVNVVNLH